jgi:hypothetical protein
MTYNRENRKSIQDSARQTYPLHFNELRVQEKKRLQCCDRHRLNQLAYFLDEVGGLGIQ